MAHYIDKSALVAELKKRFDYRVNGLKAIENGTFWNEDQSEDEFNAALTRCAYNAAKNEIFELMCFIDTLEVKEVGISIPNIDDTLKEEGLDPDSKEAKVFKESYYMALEKLKAQKGELV